MSHSLLLFMTAALTLNLTPGPDMLYVATRSASEGRPAGIASALGIGVGTLVHIAAVALGLAALLKAVPVAFAAVRLAGAAYLVWLGVKALRGTGRTAVDGPQLAPASLGAIFRQGIVTNVLNPKVALFFLAFLPAFVDARSEHAARQVVMLGLLFDTSGTLVNLAVALLASHAAHAIRGAGRGATWLKRATGVVFVGLGVRLAWGVKA